MGVGAEVRAAGASSSVSEVIALAPLEVEVERARPGRVVLGLQWHQAAVADCWLAGLEYLNVTAVGLSANLSALEVWSMEEEGARASLDGPPIEIALAGNGARWVREEVDAVVAATLAGLAQGESAAACPPPLQLRPTLAGTLQLVGPAVVVALAGCVAGIARCASRRLAEPRPVVRVTQRKGFELTELM